MTYRVEREQPDGTFTVDDGLTGLQEAEADASVKLYADNGITARKVQEDAPTPEPEAAPVADTAEAVAADMAAYMAENFPQPRVASDYALLEYHAGVEDALIAGKTPVDIGRDDAIQALARAAGKSPNPTSVTRYAQGVRRERAAAADEAADVGRPPAVEEDMQEPTEPLTAETPAADADAAPANAIGPMAPGDVIYGPDGSQHVVVRTLGAKGMGKTACSMRVPARDVDWSRTPLEPGRQDVTCEPCSKVLTPALVPQAEDADAPAAPAPKASRKKGPKVTEAATMAEALTPEPEKVKPVWAPKVPLIPTSDERYPDVQDVIGFNFSAPPALLVCGHAVVGLSTTVCGRTPDMTKRSMWRYIPGPLPVTCDACRRALHLPSRKTFGGTPQALRARLAKAWLTTDEPGEVGPKWLTGKARQTAILRARAKHEADKATRAEARKAARAAAKSDKPAA